MTASAMVPRFSSCERSRAVLRMQRSHTAAHHRALERARVLKSHRISAVLLRGRAESYARARSHCLTGQLSLLSGARRARGSSYPAHATPSLSPLFVATLMSTPCGARDGAGSGAHSATLCPGGVEIQPIDLDHRQSGGRCPCMGDLDALPTYCGTPMVGRSVWVRLTLGLRAEAYPTCHDVRASTHMRNRSATHGTWGIRLDARGLAPPQASSLLGQHALGIPQQKRMSPFGISKRICIAVGNLAQAVAPVLQDLGQRGGALCQPRTRDHRADGPGEGDPVWWLRLIPIAVRPIDVKPTPLKTSALSPPAPRRTAWRSTRSIREPKEAASAAQPRTFSHPAAPAASLCCNCYGWRLSKPGRGIAKPSGPQPPDHGSHCLAADCTFTSCLRTGGRLQPWRVSP